MRACVVAAVLLAASAAAAGSWDRLASLPDKEGFAGAFAGVSSGALLVAGGANFPDKKPWEGGKKVWSDAVFVLERPDGEWRLAGRLPRPLGYGVSATYNDGIICVGGGHAGRNFADVFRLEWKDGRLVTTPLPPLPRPVANACGVMVGDSLYIAGGQETPDAVTTLKTVYRADLSAETLVWEATETWPGPGRMLATAAGFDGKFWLVGGVDLAPDGDSSTARKYLRDAYCYDPAAGWERIADLPIPLAACPSPAPVDDSGFDVLGGDDGSQVGVAPDRHRGFRTDVLRFDAITKAWAEAGTLPAPRVTTPCVLWDRAWVIPSGEARPGVRSPEVWRFRPEAKESPRRGR